MKSAHFLMTASLAIVLASCLFATGCGQTDFSDALPVSLAVVDSIRDSETLTAKEMRDQLSDYGIDDVTLNGLLVDIRLANQFGGDLQSAYDKVVNGQLTELTPDEIQYYGDATEQTTYTDDEAQAIADFFEDEEINTVDELDDFLDESADLLPDDIDEDVLQSVFIDTSTDDVLAQL